MCIAVFMWQDHPLYPLILLLNRDEYYSRPTKPADWWEGEEILGGRDELAGGTWLACSRSGKLAFVTNVRELPSGPLSRSRGDLPIRFLKSEKNSTQFAQEVLDEAHEYNGFNLILVDIRSKSLVYVTNRAKEDNPSIQEVSPGVHVLSNASLGTPWFKVERLQHNFKELMKTTEISDEVNVKDMIEKLMTDPVKGDKNLSPGIYSPEMEYELSSIFISDSDFPLGHYGTRSTIGMTIKFSGEVTFYERYLHNSSWKDHNFSYQIEEKERSTATT